MKYVNPQEIISSLMPQRLVIQLCYGLLQEVAVLIILPH